LAMSGGNPTALENATTSRNLLLVRWRDRGQSERVEQAQKTSGQKKKVKKQTRSVGRTRR